MCEPRKVERICNVGLLLKEREKNYDKQKCKNSKLTSWRTALLSRFWNGFDCAPKTSNNEGSWWNFVHNVRMKCIKTDIDHLPSSSSFLSRRKYCILPQKTTKFSPKWWPWNGDVAEQSRMGRYRGLINEQRCRIDGVA